MRAKLSVVIPTLNAAAALPACLSALMAGVETGLIRELVISDSGSQDATMAIAEEAGAVQVSGPPSRGGQLRRGAGAAGGDWLLFLHADSQLPDGWTDAVEAQMAAGRPACFRLKFDARGMAPALVAGWANLRSRLLGLPYGDQGLLISRADYDAIGGFPDIPLMEGRGHRPQTQGASGDVAAGDHHRRGPVSARRVGATRIAEPDPAFALSCGRGP